MINRENALPRVGSSSAYYGVEMSVGTRGNQYPQGVTKMCQLDLGQLTVVGQYIYYTGYFHHDYLSSTCSWKDHVASLQHDSR